MQLNKLTLAEENRVEFLNEELKIIIHMCLNHINMKKYKEKEAEFNSHLYYSSIWNVIHRKNLVNMDVIRLQINWILFLNEQENILKKDNLEYQFIRILNKINYFNQEILIGLELNRFMKK